MANGVVGNLLAIVQLGYRYEAFWCIYHAYKNTKMAGTCPFPYGGRCNSRVGFVNRRHLVSE